MKQAIVFILIGALIGAGGVWLATHHGGKVAAAATEKPAEEKEGGTSVTHDTNGLTVVKMDDDTQGDIGIGVANPEGAKLTPELKGYGRVQDPSPLIAAVNDLAVARAAYVASSNEYDRAKNLAAQGNASTRVLQNAEAAAQRDALAVRSARDKLALSWGDGLAERGDLAVLLQSLTSREAALVRIDLPAGENIGAQPNGARLVSLAGTNGEAEFFGEAPSVDPQMQGRGFYFLLKPNSLRLAPGEAVTAYMKLPGEPLSGAVIPRDAVIRTAGSTWVYVLNEGGDAFTRTPVALEHPVEGGWFVTNAVTPGNHVVVTGAQVLLSEELKASLKAD
jgi:hypothetical protein